MPAQTTAAVAATALPTLLRQHLTGWAGGLPSADELRVVASARNAEPGWDGRPQMVTGIADPACHTVVAVPPAAASRLARHHGQPWECVKAVSPHRHWQEIRLYPLTPPSLPHRFIQPTAPNCYDFGPPNVRGSITRPATLRSQCRTQAAEVRRLARTLRKQLGR
jgi:hypothetical protein